MSQMLQKYENFEQAGSAQYLAVKTYDYLRTLYGFFRERQEEIDNTFDSVSQSIGLVITTTLPIQVVLSNGKINSISIGTSQLMNTLFEQKFSTFLQTFKTLSSDQLSTVPDGNYSLYLIWLDALSLRIRSDFMEPVNSRRSTSRSSSNFPSSFRSVPPVVEEPVHWIDVGLSIDLSETIQISAIDEIYPELKLADRIILARQISRISISSETSRSTNLRNIEETIPQERLPQFLDDMASLLRRYGYRF